MLKGFTIKADESKQIIIGLGSRAIIAELATATEASKRKFECVLF